MPPLLEGLYDLQRRLTGLDERERLLLKMFANLVESHYEVADPKNRLTDQEYFQMPGRWELADGMLQDY